jgi:hypothetical protein
MAGYSGTPLAKKLGIKPGSTLFVEGVPDGYPSDGATLVRTVSDRVDIIHLFTKSVNELAAKLRRYRSKMRPNATV